MKFRFRYKIAGGHVHVRVFAGTGDTLGKCGDLVFREEEWLVFSNTLAFASGWDAGFTTIEIVEDDQ